MTNKHLPPYAATKVDNLLTLNCEQEGFVISLLGDKLVTGQQKTEMMARLMRVVMSELNLTGIAAFSSEDHLTHLMDLEATWCNLVVTERPDGSTEAMRLHSLLAEYGGDKAHQKRDIEATLGMIAGFGQTLGPLVLALIEAGQQFDNKMGAQHNMKRVGDV